MEADPDHESLYLVIDGADNRPVAVAPALIIRDTRGLLFYNGPRIIGDLSAIGSVSHLALDEQEALPWLTAGVEAARPALYPSLTVGTFGSNLGLRPFAPDRTTLPRFNCRPGAGQTGRGRRRTPRLPKPCTAVSRSGGGRGFGVGRQRRRPLPFGVRR